MNRLLFHFRLWSYVWVFCGFLALALTDHFGPGLLGLVVLAMCLSPFVEKLGDKSRGYRRLWSGASLLYVLVIPFDLQRSGLVLGVAHLVIFIQIVKLLNKKENKDYVQMYLMSFFQLLAAAVLTRSLSFSIALVSFTVAAVWTLVLFNLKVEIEAAASVANTGVERIGEPRSAMDHRQRGSRLRIVDANLVMTNVAVSVVAVLLIAVFFYTVPRLEAGWLSRPEDVQQIGFTAEVKLATYRKVFSNPTLVMRIEMPEFPEGFPGELYWQAMSLDHYDGERWAKFKPRYSRRQRVRPDSEGVYKPTRETFSDADLIEQIVHIDSLDTSYLFGLPEMKRVVGDFGRIFWDPSDKSWFAPRLSQEGLRYKVYSLVSDFEPERLRRSTTVYPDVVKTVYVEQLPRDLDPKIYSLASDITRRATNPYDKARAIESYLGSNYLYSLVPLPERDEAPLEDFLFESKKGHCEFFATAMAVLLRCSGVPARLASGFRGGEWNEIGKFYSVRQDFAHVWVEVFFPEVGWVPFDPSPTLDFAEMDESWWGAIKAYVWRYTLALQLKWYNYVMGYNEETQWDMVASIRRKIHGLLVQSAENLASFAGRLRLIPDGTWRPVAITVYLAGVGYFFLRLRRFMVVRRRRVLAGLTGSLSPARRRAAALYADMLFAYARHGMVKRADRTPLEFLSELMDRPAAERQLGAQLTGAYHRSRFGGYPFHRTDEKHYREMLKRLERMLRG